MQYIVGSRLWKANWKCESYYCLSMYFSKNKEELLRGWLTHVLSNDACVYLKIQGLITVQGLVPQRAQSTERQLVWVTRVLFINSRDRKYKRACADWIQITNIKSTNNLLFESVLIKLTENSLIFTCFILTMHIISSVLFIRECPLFFNSLIVIVFYFHW